MASVLATKNLVIDIGQIPWFHLNLPRPNPILPDSHPKLVRSHPLPTRFYPKLLRFHPYKPRFHPTNSDFTSTYKDFASSYQNFTLTARYGLPNFTLFLLKSRISKNPNFTLISDKLSGFHLNQISSYPNFILIHQDVQGCPGMSLSTRPIPSQNSWLHSKCPKIPNPSGIFCVSALSCLNLEFSQNATFLLFRCFLYSSSWKSNFENAYWTKLGVKLVSKLAKNLFPTNSFRSDERSKRSKPWQNETFRQFPGNFMGPYHGYNHGLSACSNEKNHE